MDTRTIFILLLLALLAATLGVAGYFYWELESQPEPFPIPDASTMATPTPSGNSIDMDIYYLTPDQTQLVVEKSQALKPNTITDRIRKALEILMTRQPPDNLISPIPQQAKLQSVFWSEMDGRAYLSFSKELISGNPDHLLSEWGEIYCIVNTAAAQSATVKDVQILVDGTVINEGTTWDWSMPFAPDMTFVRYTPGQNS